MIGYDLKNIIMATSMIENMESFKMKRTEKN